METRYDLLRDQDSEHAQPQTNDTINAIQPDLSNSVSRADVSQASARTSQNVIHRKPLHNTAATTPRSEEKSVQTPQKPIYKIWWTESLACFGLLAAFFAIIATLYPHQDKPLPQWPYSISVNSLISIYIVVLKSSMTLVIAEGLSQLKWTWYKTQRPLYDLVTFDKASRGSKGAAELLWTVQGNSVLSTTGALVVVFMLGIDPFAQQLIHYYDCSVTLSGYQALLPRTNWYRGVSGLAEGGDGEALALNLQLYMNAAVDSFDSFIKPSCLTGNCSFPQPYSTLAFCHTCEDLTEQVTFSNTTTRAPPTTGEHSVGLSTSPYLLNMSVPVQSPLIGAQPSAVVNNCPCGSYGSYNFSTMSTNPYYSNSDPANVRWQTVMIFSGFLGLPYDESLGSTPTGCSESPANITWRCTGRGACSCSLYPCVRTYIAEIEGGVLKETRIADPLALDWVTSWGLPNVSELRNQTANLGVVDTECLNTSQRSILVAQGYDVGSSTRWLAYNASFNSQLDQNLLANSCLYMIEYDVYQSLYSDYLAEFFNGTIQGLLGEQNQVISFDGPQNLQTINNFGNSCFDIVNNTFANISEAATIYIRQNGLSNYSDPTTGTVHHYATCIRVRWWWLAFPATLVMATLVFFIAMIIMTSDLGEARGWKSNPLALVFHGLQDSDSGLPRKDGYDIGDVNGMDRVAKKKIVRLMLETNRDTRLVED